MVCLVRLLFGNSRDQISSRMRGTGYMFVRQPRTQGIFSPRCDVVRLSQLVENGAGYKFEPAYTSRLATVHPSFPTSLRVNLEPENTITQRYVKWRMPPSYSTDGAGTSNNSSWVGYIYIYINIYVTVVIATDETFIY